MFTSCCPSVYLPCVCVCRDDFNIEVLHAFLELHEFTDLNLVQALRQFLWSFRLPGEAQKIDRMMEAFALRYCRCNPGVFQSTGTSVCVCKSLRSSKSIFAVKFRHYLLFQILVTCCRSP